MEKDSRYFKIELDRSRHILIKGKSLNIAFLIALKKLASEKAKPTATTEKDFSKLLDYLKTYPRIYY